MRITRITLALVLSMSMLMPPGRHQVLLAGARPASLIIIRRRGNAILALPLAAGLERAAAGQ
ncbi:hypothetical protein DIE18_02905 [Burkholderia sp. Bp9125]|nr:hypothetical protein DIE18_02905 [Burkholderia sp. Bp9125]